MHISSRAFEDNARIPLEYTCDVGGLTAKTGGVNPPLHIDDIPDGAKSLVLIMEDPDSPVGTWDHWVVFNMPVQSESFYIEEGAEPEGDQGLNGAGGLGYYNPCPNAGEHRYIFTVYALDGGIDLPQGASKVEVLEAIMNEDPKTAKILAMVSLTGRYSRIAAGTKDVHKSV